MSMNDGSCELCGNKIDDVKLTFVNYPLPMEVYIGQLLHSKSIKSHRIIDDGEPPYVFATCEKCRNKWSNWPT